MLVPSEPSVVLYAETAAHSAFAPVAYFSPCAVCARPNFSAVTCEFCRSGLSSSRCSARSPMVLDAVDNASVVAVYPPLLISAPLLGSASSQGFREHVGHGRHIGEPIEPVQVDRHPVVDL